MMYTLPAQAATAIYQITTDKVNLRVSPSQDSDVLTLVRLGTEVTLLSSVGNGWSKVSVNGTVGYMSDEYLTLSGIVSSSDTLTAKVTARKLYVRIAASSSAKSIALVEKGTAFTVYGMSGDWLQVNYNGQTAYISKAYVTLTSSADSGNVPVPTAAPTAAPTPTPGPTAVPVYTETLKVGSRGSSVTAMQNKLIALGYLSGPADGIFGTGTKTAVINFQRTASLRADGVAGPETLTVLDQAYNSLPSHSTTPVVTPTPEPENPSVLKKGSRGAEVTKLQQNLISLGYLTGKADGIFGTATQSAVRAFQAANGLKVDGQAGTKTLAAVANAIAAISNATTLQEGSKGDAVKSMQQKLIVLGYLNSSADGIYGSKTKAAVATFQLRNSLASNGIANAATLTAIDTAYNNNTNTPNGNTIIVPGNIPDDNNVVNVDTDTSKFPVLKYGNSGSYVQALQTRLKALGYFTGNIGGNFGTLTQNAVISYQIAAGLQADGIVGSQTWASLFSSNAPAQTHTALTEGNSGAEVTKLQTRLKELGYFSSAIDGKYGPRTTAAVAAFQNKAGLNVDGVAGPSTLAAVYSNNAPSSTAPANPSDPAGIKDTDLTVAAQIVALAKQQLGCKYVYAREAPPYFDCSGLTQYCYKQFGYKLKRTAYEQGYDNSHPKITRIEDLQLGDCIYFNTNETDSDLCDHAGIYLGDYQFIHASSSAGKVTYGSLASGYYREHFSWGRRVLGQ
ncbi:MAG: peptidoglycan-binding protein [Clostridia bacterium]|nr:peptidoglycan-binding protein [Clostridia bacterium]